MQCTDFLSKIFEPFGEFRSNKFKITSFQELKAHVPIIKSVLVGLAISIIQGKQTSSM